MLITLCVHFHMYYMYTHLHLHIHYIHIHTLYFDTHNTIYTSTCVKCVKVITSFINSTFITNYHSQEQYYANNTIEFTGLHFVIITAINERSYVTLHTKRVSFTHLTGMTSLVSCGSFEIGSSNRTRSG